MKHVIACLVLFIAGCATGPGPAPSPAPASSSAAVSGLVQQAQADMDAGRAGAAAASLERALRMEPRNARLWHELARARLAQGDYAQAQNLAVRSNTLAAGDGALRAANDALIEEARARRAQ